MNKFFNYIQEAYDELIHKVTWPSPAELQKTSLIVIIALAVSSLIILGMDFISKEVMNVVHNIAAK